MPGACCNPRGAAQQASVHRSSFLERRSVLGADVVAVEQLRLVVADVLDRELELVCVDGRLQGFDARRELGVRDDLGRDVDRHGEPLGHRGPARGLRDDLVEHEPRQRNDGAVRLGERYEVARRHELAGVGPPTHESFGAADVMRRDLDLGLVVDLELALRNGALQLGLEFPQRRLLLRRIGPVDVERDVLLARFLERELGAAKQRRRIVGV